MTADELRTKILDTANYLRARGVKDQEIGMVLGTGLNDYSESIEDALIIPYSEIPNFHTGKVDSHKGEMVFGRVHGKNVVIMAGRYHYYESMDIREAVFPTRVLVELGIKRFIVTNAAGCVNEHGLSFYVEAQNVTNARKFQYMGDMSRVYEVRFMGPTARCGFTYKF